MFGHEQGVRRLNSPFKFGERGAGAAKLESTGKPAATKPALWNSTNQETGPDGGGSDDLRN